MTFFARCPECGKPMEVERVHNGVAYVWHGIHCGWGQGYMGETDVFFAPNIDQAYKILEDRP